MLNFVGATTPHLLATWNSSISISQCCKPKRSQYSADNLPCFHACHLSYYRQLLQARERIATGLKKLLETNDLVVKMEVGH